MVEFICQYGNCDETDTPITITDRKAAERARFCCQEHAALYLMRRVPKLKALAMEHAS